MRQRVIAYVSLIAVLLAVALAYRPGLDGGFLFDDFANLPSLGATGPIDNAPVLARYLTSSTADPTGRPVVVASFLIDARDWPADPAPFKRTNLIIHLLNTLLLAALLLTLGRRAAINETHARQAAILGAAIWSLHPFLVSTTLYIVQREAMLPATFTLAGLLLWLEGRRRLIQGKKISGICLELAGLGLGTLLATFSKANGALLPFYVLLIEHILLRPSDQERLPQTHRILVGLLWLPVLGIFAYLLHTAHRFVGGPPPFARDWTLDQRLLTEPRVIWEYLRLLWLPRPFTSGLFNDQIRVSTSLLQPATTLPAILGMIGLISSAWLLRKRLRFCSAAILFFFAAHLIESTAVPLELYFEHRNYLPAMLLFWPLAIVLVEPGPALRGRLALAAMILCGLGLMTHARAQVWGNTTEQALLWAQINPDSPRAQTNAAQIMTDRGHPEWAESRLRALLKQSPHEIQIAFNLIGADCKLQGIPAEDLEATRKALKQTRRLASLALNWLGEAIDLAQAGTCPGLTLANVETLLDAAWSNPAVQDSPGWQQDIFNLRGKLALARQQPEQAYTHFVAGLLKRVNPGTALEQAATLGRAGQQKLAICELELWERQPVQSSESGLSMARLHEWVLRQQNYWPNEVTHLKAALAQDMPSGQRSMACPAMATAR